MIVEGFLSKLSQYQGFWTLIVVIISRCRRHRDMQADDSPYKILLDTVVTEATKVSMHILNIKNNVKFKLEVTALEV